jgi:hypothetical protein
MGQYESLGNGRLGKGKKMTVSPYGYTIAAFAVSCRTVEGVGHTARRVSQPGNNPTLEN